MKVRPTAPFAVAALAVLLSSPSPVMAQNFLTCAKPFAVLGASKVSNTGPTTITGDLGLWPAAATNFTTTGGLTLNGAFHLTDGVAQNAQGCATTAYNTLAGLGSPTNLTGTDLGDFNAGNPLSPGVYFFSGSAQLTGTLVLDFGTTPTIPFVFQIGSTLTTASSAVVSVLNGNAFSGVYWQVGSSATLGTSTTFQGNIIALASITMNTTAKILCGRAIARTAAVTLDQNVISNDCDDTIDFGSGGFSGGPTSVIPEPSTLALLVVPFGVGLVALVRRGRRSPPGSVAPPSIG